jgi:asparagine synthase (glutamine-hydrolysing)
MCGIVGVLYHDQQRKCSEQMLSRMRDFMIHRGPDDLGLYTDGNLGLGHRRLSIIGVATGHQPLSNEDDSLWIVFNGEIYNYKAIRNNLINKGHKFKSESDTEVILHLYEEMGDECVKELNGMFAFAIWDTKAKSLFLARDRMGIKPLYYASTDKAFLFSSEIKALFESDCLVPECNNEAVPEYFLFRSVAGERTLFKGVYSLLPGHTMRISGGNEKTKQYWTPYPDEINTSITYQQAQEELLFLLQDSVRIRMMSEVPLGTFCSGGIDSSLVTAVAAQEVSHPINTFSVGFYETEYDETGYARLVSARYNTDHHEIKLDNAEFADLLPGMIWHNDEPLNFANSVQIYAISKLAKDHVTVVLTGEGADELFAGYPRYQIPQLVAMLKKFPKLYIPILKLLYTLTGDHRFGKLLRSSRSTIRDALLFNSAPVTEEQLHDPLDMKVKASFPFREECLDKTYNLTNPVGQLSLLDQLTYLVSILYRQDKMSMGASVEARVPFLDYRIVELANSLPMRFKLGKGKRKRLVQDVAQSYLPREIINRKKSGFGVPLANWFKQKNGLGAMAEELSDDNTLENVFSSKEMSKIVAEHNSGKSDHSDIMWNLINFKIWKKTFQI